ncbi:tetratricopeptide repeat protein 28-like [Corticium candelabrum]|uniref:tetratricopeptide repeat protein 28-like n=1 Tax=Corticium candelabrum TaxID=121492 RepID=UPI002E25C3E5|nr:tetratricopeptide repeat protein 28-like [Corticium candelabrum]
MPSSKHSYFYVALSSLSKCYLLLNDISKATTVAEEGVSIQRSILDPQHLCVATSTLILAECYCFSGDVTNAIINLNQCIEIFRTKLPLAKEGLCKALKGLGICYFGKDMFPESILFLQESIDLYHSLHCEVEINLAEALLCLGMNYAKVGDFANAAEPIRKSLSGLVEQSADYILALCFLSNVALALYMLATCLFPQAHFSECLQLYLQVRHILVQNRETTSEIMAQVCFMIGSCHMEMSHQREAEKPLLESIEIYKAVTPTGSLEMGTAYARLGSLYDVLGDITKATEMLSQGLSVLQQIPLRHQTANVAALTADGTTLLHF